MAIGASVSALRGGELPGGMRKGTAAASGGGPLRGPGSGMSPALKKAGCPACPVESAGLRGCALPADTTDEVLQPHFRVFPVFVQPGTGASGGPVAHGLAQVVLFREQHGRRFPARCGASPRSHINASERRGKRNLAKSVNREAGAEVARRQR